MNGWAALHAAGPGAVEAFIAATDVEGECPGCGRVPREGCACRETPDLIGVLDRRRARRSLQRVAAATNAARQAA